MGASKELFMALRQGLTDGLAIEEERRRTDKRRSSSTIIKTNKKNKDETKKHK